MPTKQEEKQHPEQAKQDRQQRKATIGRHVLHTLGHPDALYRMQVHHLWEECYRVNVLVGTDAASAKVAHSFFVVADRDGNITTSTPKIARLY